MAEWGLLRGRQSGYTHEEHGARRPMDELQEAMENPKNIRCICLLGDLGHGKTSLVQLLQKRFGLNVTDDSEKLCVPPKLRRCHVGVKEHEENRCEQDRREPAGQVAYKATASTTRLEVHTLLFPTDDRLDANEKSRDILGIISGRMKGSLRTNNRMSSHVMNVMAANSFMQATRERSKSRYLANSPAPANKNPAAAKLSVSGMDGSPAGRGPRKTLMSKDVLDLRGALDPKADDGDEKRTMTEPMVCYVMDTPGHADFVAESLLGLHLADSALLVVDAIEGISAHTEKLIRRSVSEQCHLSLIISGFDRCLRPGAGAEYLEDVIRNHVRTINSVVSSCPREIPEDGYPGVQAEAGQLVFGSVSQGWLLSLGRLGRHFCARYGLKEDVMCQKMWSEVGEELKEVAKVFPPKRHSKTKLPENHYDSRKSIFPGSQPHPSLASVANVVHAMTAMKKGVMLGSTPGMAGMQKRSTVVLGDPDSLAAGIPGLQKRGTVHMSSDSDTNDTDNNFKKRGTIRHPTDDDASDAVFPNRQTLRRQQSQDDGDEDSLSPAHRSVQGSTASRGSMARRASRRKSAQRKRASSMHAAADGKFQVLTLGRALPDQLRQVKEEGLVACAVGGSLTVEARDSRPGSASNVAETTESREKARPSLLRSLVLDPIVQLVRALEQKNWDKVNAMLIGLGAGKLVEEEEKTLMPDSLLAKVMCLLADGAGAEDVLQDLFFLKLPPPSTAQMGICERLLLGPADSKHAVSIHCCSPAGALIISVVRMLPSCGAGNKENGRRTCYALGRVFSGTVAVGSKVRVDCSSCGIDAFDARAQDARIAEVQAIALPAGSFAVPLSSIGTVTAGNLVLLRGPDQFLSKAGTLLDPSIDITSTTLIPLEVAATAPPQVRVSVRPANAAGLPRLVAALKHINKADPVAICRSEEWGEHLIAGTGEAHLDCCLQELRSHLSEDRTPEADVLPADVELVFNKPGACSGYTFDALDAELPSWAHFSVPYRETVCGAFGGTCRTACANNSPPVSFEATALPLGEQLSAELEDGLLFLGDRPRQRGLLLAERYGWDAAEGCRIWCFGPRDGCGTNAFLDLSTSLPGQEASCGAGAWPAVTAACRWASVAGGLCEEPLRGVRFRLALQRSPGSIGDETDSLAWPPGGAALEQQRRRRHVGDAAHRCLLAAQVNDGAVPGLQEPIVKVHITLRASPRSSVEILRQALQGKRRVEFVAGWESWEHQRGVDSVERSAVMPEHYAENPVEKPSLRLAAFLPRLEALGLEQFLQDTLPQDHDGISSCRPFLSVQTAFSHWETLPGSLVGECPDSEYLRELVLGLRRWRQLKGGLPVMADFLQERAESVGSDAP
eukprot:TRINITY_DN7162_c0_g2_i2.p1 TRINITY_DN7162_c0_g2~~TRINITY_DN7162_c0_g2_i2.p1  ORF type:complete len:1354 (-),score=218.48 TRINITY_DN7162_c0_g2_i2:168-4229(-)